MDRKNIPVPFAHITNAEEQSWSYGIENLYEQLLYYLAIDYWYPSMFSSDADEKYIELPFECLDICSEVLLLPKLILAGTISNYKHPFYLSIRRVAYCLRDVVLDEGKSKIIKKGMCLYRRYVCTVQLFIDVLKEEVLPIVSNNSSEYENILKEIELMEKCSVDAPFYLYNFCKITEHYLGCRYGTGSQALIELLESSFSSNRLAFIDIAMEKHKAMQARPDKTIEDIIDEKKRLNGTRIKKGLPPIEIPNVEEAKLLQKEEKTRFEIQKEYSKKRVERFREFEKSGLDIRNLFVKRIRILSEEELSQDPEHKDILIRNYNSVLHACNNINRLLRLNTPEIIIRDSKKDLQQRVDVLLYNLIIFKYFNLHIKKNKKRGF